MLRPLQHLLSLSSHLVAHPSMTPLLQSLQLSAQKRDSVVPLHRCLLVRLRRRHRRQDRLLRLHLLLSAVDQLLTAEAAWSLQLTKPVKTAKERLRNTMETTIPISPLERSTKMR